MTESEPVPSPEGTGPTAPSGSEPQDRVPHGSSCCACVVSASRSVWLVSKVRHVDDSIPAQHHGFTFLLLLGAVVTAFVGVILSAWRWQRVLLLFDVRVPLRTLASNYLVGLFVGNVLPSTIGGDVVRVTRSAKPIGSSSVAFASVVLERLTGFVALPLLVFFGFAICRRRSRITPTRGSRC